MQNNLAEELTIANQRLAMAVRERDDVLRRLRLECKHLKLVELEYKSDYISTRPPRRICVDCGAEEDGWYCGYHVLTLKNDTWSNSCSEERVLLETTKDTDIFYRYRKAGPLYKVGQSHPNFKGGGIKTYVQLTEISA